MCAAYDDVACVGEGRYAGQCIAMAVHQRLTMRHEPDAAKPVFTPLSASRVAGAGFELATFGL